MRNLFPKLPSKSALLKFLFLPAASFLFFGIRTYLDGSGSFIASRAFDQFTERMFSTEVASSTLNLHYTLEHPENYGITEMPVTFGAAAAPVSLTGASPTIEDYQRELSRIPYHSLSASDQLTYDTLSLYLENERERTKFRYYDEPLGATIGVQAQLPVLLAEYTFRDMEDIETYLSLLSQMDTYYRSLLDYEISKSAAGLFMNEKNAESIIAQCRSFAAGSAKENFLVTIFEEKLAALDFLNDAQRTVFCSRNLSAVKNHVLPAYELLADGLEQLKTTGKNPGGLCYLHNGKAYYEYLIRAQTGSWLPVSGIENRIRTQLQQDMEACRRLLTADPQLLQNADFSDLPKTPEEILSDLKQQLTDDFPTPVKTTCEVKYVHDSLEPYLSPAFYLTPPIDDLAWNVIYINRASDYSPLELYTTLAHEGYPGHLYQNISSYRTLSPVRSLLGFGGYTEGWATYVEMESYDYAAQCIRDAQDGVRAQSDDPQDSRRMQPDSAPARAAECARLNRSVMLGISSLLDICIHYHGYTREETAAFLERLGFTSRTHADAVYDAILESPANYLKYYLGYLTFSDLRLYCEAAYTDLFDLRDFHGKILEIGPCPFPVLEKYLKAWYERRS